jgi:cytochrome c oxidase cbb3-type subunit III
MATKREVDEHSQTETTGHEWDGIKELDTPMPRWWLWTFYATIVWGAVYMLLMPAWPLVTQATPGLLGYSSRASVAADIAAAREANAPLDARINEIELASVADDPELLRYAIAGGGAVFRNHCGQCHGAGGQGAIGGYPNLLDDAWLWGGSVDDIYQTILHGIRYDPDPDTRFSQMPAFGEILEPEEIDGLVQYVLSLSGADHDAELAAASAESYLNNCSACHGEDGGGMYEQGAPNLSDGIWLYGGDPDAIRHTIVYSRYGIMPSFSLNDRLRDAEIRKVAVYVHSLGGGQ